MIFSKVLSISSEEEFCRKNLTDDSPFIDYDFEGDPCDKCGNFTMYKKDNSFLCLTCNHIVDEWLFRK